ncbi:MAG: tRNA glutamyl-Q(34) synthetase GluQRS [Mailhella sp.]|nr:tRNA glutamyl-Q(34) synthetase GluQRS [Mailhella sp.]
MTSASAAAARPVVGRLAPSPTGLLHLGNAWSFLMAWLDARTRGGTIILRHEDIDPARSRPEWREGIERDLRWLGIDWDEGPGMEGSRSPYLQSERGAVYESALEKLSGLGLVYPCFCTRRELRMLAGAPHGAADGLGDCGAPYPGTCRRLSDAEREERARSGRHAALRLLCPDGEDGRMTFSDRLAGEVSCTLSECGGDFPLRRSDGVWSYQLAVCADDIAMGVTSVVRGEDILFSTPRQLRLYRLLGGTPPEYAHLPLLCDGEGKRHGGLSLQALRERGFTGADVIGSLACAARRAPDDSPLTPAALAEKLRTGGGIPWSRIPRGKITVPERFLPLCS